MNGNIKCSKRSRKFRVFQFGPVRRKLVLRGMGQNMAGARIEISHERIAAFCRQHHIRKLAFFGSVLREDFRANSDVDVLVEFEPGFVPGLEFFALEDELRNLGSEGRSQYPRFLK